MEMKRFPKKSKDRQGQSTTDKPLLIFPINWRETYWYTYLTKYLKSCKSRIYLLYANNYVCSGNLKYREESDIKITQGPFSLREETFLFITDCFIQAHV